MAPLMYEISKGILEMSQMFEGVKESAEEGSEEAISSGSGPNHTAR